MLKTFTHHDLAKTLALVLMVVDHIGAFFLPDVHEWRLIGRLSAPIWLFLVGYADTRDIPRRFIVGIIILCAAVGVAGGSLFPLNIIVSIILVRCFIDRIIATTLKDTDKLFAFCVAMAVLAFPLNILFDYGAFAFLFALYGAMVRHPEKNHLPKMVAPLYALSIAGFYAVYESFVFRFDVAETAIVGAGTAMVLLFMGYFFFAKEYHGGKMASVASAPLRWGGKYSLEFYVVHLSLLRIGATYWQTLPTHWGHPVLFPWQ